MSGHKPFKNLSTKLQATPDGRAAVQRERRIMRDMLALAELREARGMTQTQLTEAWDVSQRNISRIEHEQDVYLSTLRNYVEALGGHIEVTAVFADQRIPLCARPSEQPAELIG
jgi:DNA-binding XRE family transcriptional regulator